LLHPSLNELNSVMLPFPPLSFLLLACSSDSGTSRRAFLGTTCATIFIGPPTIAIAQQDDNNRDLYLARPMGIAKDGTNGDGGNGDSVSSTNPPLPSAPLEYLLPAARVGVYIYQTLALAEDLSLLLSNKNNNGEEGDTNKIKTSQQKKEATIEKLNNLLSSSTKPSFITPNDPTVTRGDPYTLPPLVGELSAAKRKQIERKQQSIEVGLTPQLFEVGELMGERRSWNRLVKAEKAREDASEVRRAMNIYTTNLNFNPNKYVYSGSKEEKSKMIREDKLPSTTTVIRSDLDARDLYRNAVQTSLEDSCAEFVYLEKVGFVVDDDEGGGGSSVDDLVGLLRDARVAIDKWFSFIPEEDIRAALEVVRREQAS